MRYLETVSLSIADMEAYPGNARLHDEPALDESAATNGQYRSVVARRLPDGAVQLLAGHGTVGAFRRQGASEVRVEMIEADDAEARRIVLADNGTSRNASYDDKLLLDLIDQASKDGGLGGTGWDADAYKELLGEAGSDGANFAEDPDDADLEAPAAEAVVTATGDAWILGPHRIVCGDSSDPRTWKALLGKSEKVNAVWTDPPYGVAYVGKTADALTIENDSLDAGGLRSLLDSAFGLALKNCLPGGAWYVAAPPGPLHLVFGNALVDLGIYRQQLIWLKDQFVLGHSDYHYRHEPLFYGWAPGGPHRPPPDRTQDTVWEVPRPKRSEDHPTMKPVELVARGLRNATDPGALVADMFGGSGTTMAACHLEGRLARVIELDPKYCDVIARRYQNLTGDLPVLERTGERWDFTATPPCVAP